MVDGQIGKIGFKYRFIIAAQAVIIADIHDLTVGKALLLAIAVKGVIFIIGLRRQVKGGGAANEYAVVRKGFSNLVLDLAAF